MKDFKPSGKEQALSLRLTGKFKTAFPNGDPSQAASRRRRNQRSRRNRQIPR